MARIRCRHIPRESCSVKAERETFGLDPEVLVEPPLERERAEFRFDRKVHRVLLPCQDGEFPIRGIRVSLCLDDRNGRPNAEVVLGTVLPALVEQAIRVLALVPEVPATGIFSHLDPAVGRGEIWPQVMEERCVSGAAQITTRKN